MLALTPEAGRAVLEFVFGQDPAPDANLEWRTVQEEDRQNEQLLKRSQQILELTKEIHSSTNGHAAHRHD
jgi:hypothetical protein